VPGAAVIPEGTLPVKRQEVTTSVGAIVEGREVAIKTVYA
jgi:hypothetical protein